MIPDLQLALLYLHDQDQVDHYNLKDAARKGGLIFRDLAFTQ